MDWIIVAVVAAVGIALLIWAAKAGGPSSTGLSDADKYQQELARRSAAATAAAAQAAAAHRGTHPAGRTGYSGSGAFRTTPVQGQNDTHGQNLPAQGQNAAPQPPGVNPALVMQIQGMVRGGQKLQAIALLRHYTGMSLADAKTFVERM
ncbi:hypothetical protein [Arthrobacter sp. 35W]|uniref:hypothetical protein n=1 Tax=Arthrobacter sp. 35W TaxID=1132441 RepID=UPI000550A388|nr:hypothetical protein [Arthrobacter sp. 35W]